MEKYYKNEYQVSKENFSLMTRQRPGLVNFQVNFGRWDQPEDLLSTQDMVPDRRTAKVDVKICLSRKMRLLSF